MPVTIANNVTAGVGDTVFVLHDDEVTPLVVRYVGPSHGRIDGKGDVAFLTSVFTDIGAFPPDSCFQTREACASAFRDSLDAQAEDAARLRSYLCGVLGESPEAPRRVHLCGFTAAVGDAVYAVLSCPVRVVSAPLAGLAFCDLRGEWLVVAGDHAFRYRDVYPTAEEAVRAHLAEHHPDFVGHLPAKHHGVGRDEYAAICRRLLDEKAIS